MLLKQMILKNEINIFMTHLTIKYFIKIISSFTF